MICQQRTGRQGGGAGERVSDLSSSRPFLSL